MSISLVITEKIALKRGTPTQKRNFHLCNIAQPSQQ